MCGAPLEAKLKLSITSAKWSIKGRGPSPSCPLIRILFPCHFNPPSPPIFFLQCQNLLPCPNNRSIPSPACQTSPSGRRKTQTPKLLSAPGEPITLLPLRRQVTAYPNDHPRYFIDIGLVTSLESVVIQLQESCRESRSELVELRQENARLRLEHREREKFWRPLYQARKAGQASESDDLPTPPLSSPFLAQVQPSSLAAAPLIQHPYGSGLSYRGEDSTPCHYNTPGTNNTNFPTTISFPNNGLSADGSSGSALNHRVGKYAAYPYSAHESPRDPRWQTGAASGSLNGGESATPPHSHSPPYLESPSLTSTEMAAYPGRFSGDEQKVALTSVLDNAPYVFPTGERFHQGIGDSVPNSRSMSPSSSTPSSTASLPLNPSFQFTFHEPSAGQERVDFDYRRHSLPHCPEVTLHGGTADISLTGQSSDPLRYRVGRGPDSGAADLQPIVAPSENGSNHDQCSSDGDPPFNTPQIQSRRKPIQSHSRSPSPGPAPISCTVAVIKAQAFGALRRTRARTKKSTEGAAKVANHVLEARGIGVAPAVGSKRARRDEEDLDLETP